jgi:predicted nucleotidyltransferase
LFPCNKYRSNVKASVQTVAQELRDLAAVLADWCTPAPAATLFLFGSRVRGDHRPDSDVDVSIAWGRISDADMDWWMKNNQELFVTIDGKLPGKLQILEENDPVTLRVRSAPVVHHDRSVVCVLLPPKP